MTSQNLKIFAIISALITTICGRSVRAAPALEIDIGATAKNAGIVVNDILYTAKRATVTESFPIEREYMSISLHPMPTNADDLLVLHLVQAAGNGGYIASPKKCKIVDDSGNEYPLIGVGFDSPASGKDLKILVFSNSAQTGIVMGRDLSERHIYVAFPRPASMKGLRVVGMSDHSN